jgi:hypothetical protein
VAKSSPNETRASATVLRFTKMWSDQPTPPAARAARGEFLAL